MKGSVYPLIQTPERVRLWQQLWGKLSYQAVFAPPNATKLALGRNPTGGDPSRISQPAFIEGFPNTTVLPNYSAAQFMIEQVHKYPGQVSIYSGVVTPFRLYTCLGSCGQGRIN